MSVSVQDPATGELMNRIYRNQRHIYDLSRRFFLLGRDHLIGALDPPPGGSVLEIGCGTGRNLIAVGKRFPDARCYGIDISSQMLATAEANVAKAKLFDRVVLAECDASRVDVNVLFGRSFDRVFFSYTLSMIPDWRAALDLGVRAAAAGEGRVSVVDFSRQDGLPPLFRALLLAWLNRFHVAPRVDLRPALEETARTHAASLRATSLYRDYCVYAELRR